MQKEHTKENPLISDFSHPFWNNCKKGKNIFIKKKNLSGGLS